MKSVIIILSLVISLWAACVTNLTPGSSVERFIDNEDGTISDNKTGLVWQKCNYGLEFFDGVCGGSTVVMTWSEALQNAQEYIDDNDFTWRVPTIKELNSLIERSCVEPAMSELFDYEAGVAQRYWSSTHAEASHDSSADVKAMVIDFGEGVVEIQEKLNETNTTLRLVRTRQ